MYKASSQSSLDDNYSHRILPTLRSEAERKVEVKSFKSLAAT